MAFVIVHNGSLAKVICVIVAKWNAISEMSQRINITNCLKPFVVLFVFVFIFVRSLVSFAKVGMQI